MKIISKLTNAFMASVVAISVAGCAGGAGNFCQGENAPLCMFAAVAGGIFLAGLIGPGYLFHHAILSDKRLKTDIQYHSTLSSGLKVYGYRYKGDDRVFLGVIAQDLLKDKRFAKAVSMGKDGYYRVDYSKLGVKLVHGNTMMAAGNAALKRMH